MKLFICHSRVGWLGRACAFLCVAGMARSAAGADTEQAWRYRVRVRGVKDSAIARELTDISDAIARAKRPPASERQLRRRLQADEERFLRVLRSHGYYGATVATEIRTDRRPVRVLFRIEKGEPYRLRHIRLTLADGAAADTPLPDMSATGLTVGAIARARDVLDAEQRLAREAQRRGYPFARMADRIVKVDHAARALDAHFVFEPGPFATFGPLTIVGAPSVRETFLRGSIPWREGEPYDGDKVLLARRRWAATELFSSVRLIPEPDAQPEPALPMRAELAERKPRTLGAGAGYGSDEGARARLFWEHRNWLGAGERLHLGAAVSEIGQNAEARFRRPAFRRNDQALSLHVRAAQEDTDAFHSRNAGALLGVDRDLRQGMSAGMGFGYRHADVRERDGTTRERFGLLHLPLRWDWDRSDDLLDPRRGSRWSLGATPYADLLGSDLTFVKTRIGYTRYLRLTRRPELDWAGRAIGGVLTGASRAAIPADERFYAGGGGSVRGYGYQMAGELDGTTPLGGVALAAVSSELRWRATRYMGVVLFADGGKAFSTTSMDANSLLWGAGAGLRYFTPVGPLRLDAAVPLDRRPEADDRYQFYISLGQAF